MRHRTPRKPTKSFEPEPTPHRTEAGSAKLVHSTLFASIKLQLNQLLDEAISSFAELDVAEGHRKSAAILEALARLEVGALEALALLEEANRREPS